MRISAYVVKDSVSEELITALNQVLEGKVFVSPRIEKLLGKMGHSVVKSTNETLKTF